MIQKKKIYDYSRLRNIFIFTQKIPPKFVNKNGKKKKKKKKTWLLLTRNKELARIARESAPSLAIRGLDRVSRLVVVKRCVVGRRAEGRGAEGEPREG